MNGKIVLAFIVLTAIMALGGSAFAQSTRSHVNKGVDLYDEEKYVQSGEQFKKGLDKSPKNFQANFNLGDSYYKQGNYSDALKYFQSALSKTKSNELKSKVYHNIGNSLLKDKKIKESIAAYTDALKLNPGDMSTKYNLSYALDMLKHNKKQNKNDKNDKNNQKKNRNKQNKNNKNNPQNKNNQNRNQNRQNNQQQNQEQEKLSKEQARAIFAALNHDEQKLQKKLRKFKGKPTKIAKDW